MNLRPNNPESAPDITATAPGQLPLDVRAQSAVDHEVVQLPRCEAYMDTAVQEIAKPEAVEMLTVLGEHHPTTLNHVFGVTVLVAKLLQVTGENLNLSEVEKTSIMRAGFLHDIGKLDIDPDILNFNGDLTEQQFSMVQTHTVMGREILKLQDSYKDDELLLGLTLLHHQVRPTPYPYDKLTGANEFIADTSRDPQKFRRILELFAMADQTEALTGDRNYIQAKNFTKEDVLSRLRQSIEAFAGSTDLVDFIDAQPYIWNKHAQQYDIRALKTAFMDAGGKITGYETIDYQEQMRANQE